jgi:hypothetical protein
MSSGRSESKEYRRRVAALPEDLKKLGGDPFEVEVKAILRRLRKDFKGLGREGMLLDSQAMNAVSKVVSIQDEWLSFQLTELHVDPDLLLSKLRSCGLSQLAASIGESHHPTATVKQMPMGRLLEAADYWVQLGGWGAAGDIGPLPEGTDESAFQDLRMSHEELEKRLSGALLELSDMVRRGPLRYRDYVGGADGAKRLEKGYLLAHLCMRGAFTLKYDPASSDYLIMEAEGGADRSVALTIG